MRSVDMADKMSTDESNFFSEFFFEVAATESRQEVKRG
jgi:hypothetical protein